jgi:hypothetical protein
MIWRSGVQQILSATLLLALVYPLNAGEDHDAKFIEGIDASEGKLRVLHGRGEKRMSLPRREEKRIALRSQTFTMQKDIKKSILTCIYTLSCAQTCKVVPPTMKGPRVTRSSWRVT